jgi:hypothetical protein
MRAYGYSTGICWADFAPAFFGIDVFSKLPVVSPWRLFAMIESSNTRPLLTALSIAAPVTPLFGCRTIDELRSKGSPLAI